MLIIKIKKNNKFYIQVYIYSNNQPFEGCNRKS